MTRASECLLCGLPLLGRPVRDRDHDFCCEGCRRVWVLAADSGLSDLLSGPAERSGRVSRSAERKAIAAAAAGARRRTVRVGGMWCASCALVLEDALLALPGVLDAEISYATGLLRVTWDPSHIEADAIFDRVRLLGYEVLPPSATLQRRDVDDLFLRFFVSAVVSMWVMWPTLFLLYPAFLREAYASVSSIELFAAALSLVVLAYGGWPFLVGAWRAARVRRATMDTLVVLGTWSAWLYSLYATITSTGPAYFESAAMITTIVLFGRWLEAFGTRDATAAARVVAADESHAWLIAAAGGLHAPSEPQQVPASSLGVGDLVVVRAGERIPADGIVESGSSDIDVARLTGEPAPVPVAPGDEVLAGSVNLSGALRIRLTRVGEDSLQGRLAALVEDAAFAKASSQRLADAVAAVFVPTVLAIAAAAFGIALWSGVSLGESVSRAVSVLVVSCPCALGLAVPLAVANASAAGIGRGLALRGGPALERAGRIATVAFDKTGTVTEGHMAVVGWLPHDLPAAERRELLALAGAAESSDPHPVSAALAEARADEAVCATLAPEGIERVPGAGVLARVAGREIGVGSERLLDGLGAPVPGPLAEAASDARSCGHVVVWLAVDAQVRAGVVLGDLLRTEAAGVFGEIHRAGVATAIVSGDSLATTQAVASTLGAGQAFGHIAPHDKERVVRELRAQGPVAFVGDGVNDAAALASADLAIVTADASDVAAGIADVVLAPLPGRSQLEAVPALLRIASKARRIIAENLGWAFTYNLVALPLAATGRLSPIAAAAAMALSSLAVVANSWRLRWSGGPALAGSRDSSTRRPAATAREEALPASGGAGS